MRNQIIGNRPSTPKRAVVTSFCNLKIDLVNPNLCTATSLVHGKQLMYTLSIPYK